MKNIHVTVLTNAIVDILAHVDNGFFAGHGVEKVGYQTISRDGMKKLYTKIPPATEQSGGTLANTVAGLSALGSNVCCLARVTNDAFGKIFMHDMKASGVHFPMKPSRSEEGTGHTIILIDEAGDRHMNTYLGSSVEIGSQDLCIDSIKNSEILCVEGYFWLNTLTKESVYRAIAVAKESGTKVALGLAAVLCAKSFKEDFLELLNGSIDILFGNEEEYEALFSSDFSEVLKKVSTLPILSVITRGDQGSVIVQGGDIMHIPPVVPPQVVDATGAGDAYASGVLYGLTHGLNLKESAKLASLVAAQTVSHIGARPDQTLIRRTVKEAGFNID